MLTDNTEKKLWENSKLTMIILFEIRGNFLNREEVIKTNAVMLTFVDDSKLSRTLESALNDDLIGASVNLRCDLMSLFISMWDYHLCQLLVTSFWHHLLMPTIFTHLMAGQSLQIDTVLREITWTNFHFGHDSDLSDHNTNKNKYLTNPVVVASLPRSHCYSYDNYLPIKSHIFCLGWIHLKKKFDSVILYVILDKEAHKMPQLSSLEM